MAAVDRVSSRSSLIFDVTKIFVLKEEEEIEKERERKRQGEKVEKLDEVVYEGNDLATFSCVISG